MTTKLVELGEKAHHKAIHADSLERKVAELQQVIQAQTGDIKRLTRMAEQRYEKLSKADNKEETLQVPFDGANALIPIPNAV